MPNFVQGTGQQTLLSTTNVLAFLSNNAAGNLLVLGSENDGATTVSGVTDSQGNTWVKATATPHNFSTKSCELWYAANCKAGPNTVTATYGSAKDSAICIAEYSGAIPASPLDKVAAGKATDGSPTTSPDSGNTTTTAQARELLIGVCGSFAGAGQTYTAGSGWTKDVEIKGSTLDMAIESQTVAATGAYDATWTLGTSDQWGCCIATFKLAVSKPFLPGFHSSSVRASRRVMPACH